MVSPALAMLVSALSETIATELNVGAVVSMVISEESVVAKQGDGGAGLVLGR